MIRAATRRELVSMWAGPVPYLVGAGLHVVLGLLVVDQFEIRQQAVVQPLFPLLGFLVLLVVPVLAMRMLAEEVRARTLDVLLAEPVSIPRLVLAKWAAVTITGIVLVVPAGIHPLVLSLWGRPDLGVLAAGAIGVAGLIAAAAAIGVATSAATEAQPLAALAALLLVMGSWFAGAGGDAAGADDLGAAVSFAERLRLFAAGGVAAGDLAFYVAVVAIGLTAAVALVRRHRAGGSSPVRRVGGVAGVGMVAALLVVTADASPGVLDLTETDTLTLTAQTRDVLANVDRDIEIVAFVGRDVPGRVEAASLLDRYRRTNRRVSVRVVDPEDEPGLVERFAIDPFATAAVVSDATRAETVPFVGEGPLTGAIARILRSEDVTVCFTAGHGEATGGDAGPDGIADMVAVLDRDGYDVAEIDLLARPQVDADCGVVVVAAPTTDLGAEASEAVASWLDDDGRVLVLSDPVHDVDLAAIIEPYGIAIDRGIVLEGDVNRIVNGDAAAPIVSEYRSASPVVARLAPTFYPGVQSLIVTTPDAPGLTTSILAETSTTSYLERRPLEVGFDPGEDVEGPLAILAAADRSRVSGDDVARSRLLVAADAGFVSNEFVREAANAQLLRQVMSWLAQSEDLVALSPNVARDRPLRLTDARRTYYRTVVLGVVPALFLVAGGLVWALRRGR